MHIIVMATSKNVEWEIYSDKPIRECRTFTCLTMILLTGYKLIRTNRSNKLKLMVIGVK